MALKAVYVHTHTAASVAEILTIVARGEAKNRIVKKLQMTPSCV